MNSLWLLHFVGTPLCVLWMLHWVLPRENPAAVLGAELGRCRSTRGGRCLLGLSLLILVLNFAESSADPALSAWLDYDLTPRVRALEGDWIERVQAWTPHWIAAPLGAWYVSGYVALLIATAVLLDVERRPRALAGYMLGLAANYAYALPFYLFFPVSEVAWSGHSDSFALIERAFPGISAEMRIGSALDNCFPSLHVSCSTTALWFARKSVLPRFAGLVWVAWALVLWSVMALAIHWGSDVVSGLLLGVACGWTGERLAPATLSRLEHAR